MRSIRRTASVALVLAVSLGALDGSAEPAYALNLGPVCSAAGLLSGIAGKACNVLSHPGRLAHAGKKLITGHPGAALSALTSSSSTGASAALGLAAIVAWVTGGADFALHETVKVLSKTTSPRLDTTWFSSVYWRMAGIAALLTLPFLFAAAIQALMRSDLALLIRVTLGYLPLALLAISIAAPLTMLLLVVSDQLSAIVAAAAGPAGGHFLATASLFSGALTVLSGTPFLIFLVGLLTAAGAIALWLELVVREAAVYVVVLMLPLAFAALVWPARRIWAMRAVELLVALILSKFAIVAVLTLGAAALSQIGHTSVSAMVVGAALMIMGAFTPWALMRLLPLSELAGSAVGSLRGQVQAAAPSVTAADAGVDASKGWVQAISAGMRRQADEAAPDNPNDGAAPDGAPPRPTALADPLAVWAAGSRNGDGERVGEGEEDGGSEPDTPEQPTVSAQADPVTAYDAAQPAGAGHPAGGEQPVDEAGRAPQTPRPWEAPDLALAIPLELENEHAAEIENRPEDHDPRPAREPSEGAGL